MAIAENPTQPTQTPDQKHLVLVGMMGSGKSKVGRLVSKASKRVFFDCDTLISDSYGMPIPDIFETKGEASFREIEHDVLKKVLASQQPAIISTGGGVVLRADNRELLSEVTVVWLRSNVKNLAKRLEHSYKKRPLLAGSKSKSELRATMSRILLEREPLYETVAHHKLKVDQMRLKAIVSEVAKLAS